MRAQIAQPTWAGAPAGRPPILSVFVPARLTKDGNQDFALRIVASRGRPMGAESWTGMVAQWGAESWTGMVAQ